MCWSFCSLLSLLGQDKNAFWHACIWFAIYMYTSASIDSIPHCVSRLAWLLKVAQTEQSDLLSFSIWCFSFYYCTLLILSFWVFLCLCQDFSCSPSKPCALGCCGKNNVCGLGPSYCAPANCTSSCDQKSDCVPVGVFSGPRVKNALSTSAARNSVREWFIRKGYTLNSFECLGFCGTTSEFCGALTITAPPCSRNSSNQKTIGYYKGWSLTRSCDRRC